MNVVRPFADSPSAMAFNEARSEAAAAILLWTALLNQLYNSYHLTIFRSGSCL